MNHKDFLNDPRWQASKPGLERTYELLEKLGNPQDRLSFVHVAGTNGKGSTCAMTESVLRAAGLRTGLFTSPIIETFNEQIKVCGVDISDAELDGLTALVAPVASSMADTPTIFEITVALAFLHFLKNGCDIVVLEVGMGGEGDATNVIPAPEVAVFTPISLDHTQWLGETVEEIAKTKAGIIKPGCRVVCGRNKEAHPVIEEKAKECGCKFTAADFTRLRVHEGTGHDGVVFDYGTYRDLKLPFIPAYQAENAAVVIEVIEELRSLGYNISYEALEEGLKRALWQGRFEILRTEPTIIVDGSHNPDGMQRTVAAIKERFPKKRAVVVTGMLADKDTESMLSSLLEIADTIITTEPDNPRAMKAEDLAGKAKALGHVEVYVGGSVKEAVDVMAQMVQKDDLVALIGSLYMVSDFKKAVEMNWRTYD